MKVLIWLPFLLVVYACTQAETAQEKEGYNYCQLIKNIIDLPNLQQYFHVDLYPDRSPLIVVVGEFVNSCSALRKFGKPVEIVSLSKFERQADKAYLKLAKIATNPAHIKVIYLYEVEGLKGEVRLEKNKSQWFVTQSKIVER